MHGTLDLELLTPFVPEWRFLDDRGIRKAIKQGAIRIDPLHDESIQPGTLDIRAKSARIYDEEVRAKLAQESARIIRERPDFLKALDEDPSPEFAKHEPAYEGGRITLPSMAYAELFIQEHITPSDDFLMTLTMRSGRGREGLRHTSFMLQHDKPASADSSTPLDYYVGVRNYNPNPIIIDPGKAFAQLFFMPRTKKWLKHAGAVVTDPAEVRKLAKAISPDIETLGPYAIFPAGDTAWTYRHAGVIDTAQKTPDHLLITHALGSVEIPLHEIAVVQLQPELCVPANAGILLMHHIPYDHGLAMSHPTKTLVDLEDMAANGQWIDPGYRGKATAHITPFNAPRQVSKGEPLCVGLLIKYPRAVERPYGHASLNSHYQNSSGVTSRS